MDVDDKIKEVKAQRFFSPKPEQMYCYRCGQNVLVYKPSQEDLRRDATLEDYIGDNYCSKCIADIVGDLNDQR